MVFQNLPEGIQAAGSDILIPIVACKPDYVTELHVIKDGQILGLKRFRGAERYEVNVSCYLKDSLDIQPYFSYTRTGFVEMPSWMGHFSIKATEYPTIQDGPDENAVWMQTEDIPYTAGRVKCPVLEPLMEMNGELEICPGENLIMPIILKRNYTWSTLKAIEPDGSSQFLTLTANQDDSYKIYAYFINTPFLQDFLEFKFDESYRIEVTVGTTGEVVDFRKRIDIREMASEGTRLCWLNVYGTVDYYTFSPVQARSASMGKTKVYGPQGFRIEAVAREDALTVETPLMTPENLSRLSGILSSPKVWHVENGGETHRQIDILTKSTESVCDRPGSLRLSFRYV